MLLAAAILFLTQLAAFPAGPDTIECSVFHREWPPHPVVYFAQAFAPAAPWALAGADTADFRRDTDPVKQPFDVVQAHGGVLNLCASLDYPEWSSCAVYVSGRLVGTFVRPGENGARKRNPDRVMDGGRP